MSRIDAIDIATINNHNRYQPNHSKEAKERLARVILKLDKREQKNKTKWWSYREQQEWQKTHVKYFKCKEGSYAHDTIFGCALHGIRERDEGEGLCLSYRTKLPDYLVDRVQDRRHPLDPIEYDRLTMIMAIHELVRIQLVVLIPQKGKKNFKYYEEWVGFNEDHWDILRTAGLTFYNRYMLPIIRNDPELDEIVKKEE